VSTSYLNFVLKDRDRAVIMGVVISVLRDYLKIEKIELEQLLFAHLRFRVVGYSPSIYKSEPDKHRKASFRSKQEQFQCEEDVRSVLHRKQVTINSQKEVRPP
jgi:hypothetical protein